MANRYQQFDRTTGTYRWVDPDIRVDITKNTNKQFYVPRSNRSIPPAQTTTDYVGVLFRRNCRQRPWQARIKVLGVQVLIGYFSTDREAAIAYDREAIKLGRKTNILKQAS